MIKVFINISNVKILHCWYCELLKRSKTHSTASSHITHWQLRGAGARRSCSRPDLLIGRRLPVDLWPGLLGFCRLVADWEEELKTQVMMIYPVFLRQMKWQSVGEIKKKTTTFCSVTLVMVPTALVRPSLNTSFWSQCRYSGVLMKRKWTRALSPVLRQDLFMDRMVAVCLMLPQWTGIIERVTGDDHR